MCASLPAEELLTPGEQVQRELKAALAAPDAKSAVKLLREVGPLYRYPATPQEAQALLKLAGEASRSTDVRIARAALRAVGETGAPQGVAYVKPFLRPRAGEEPQALAALAAAGALRTGELVAPLAELAKTGSNATLADQALLALGEFCKANKELRKRVAEKLLAICQSISRNRNRWRRLRAPALRALQRLIGRRLNSLQQFHDWWKFAKARKDPFAGS